MCDYVFNRGLPISSRCITISEKEIVALGKDILREVTMEETKVEETFGDFVRRLRIEQGLSLREFWKRLEIIDVALWSRIERGVAAPPREPFKTWKVAKLLGITPDSDCITEAYPGYIMDTNWVKFKELSDKAYNNPPGELTPEEVEKETLKRLPAFPHKENGERLTEEELRSLVDMVRESVQQPYYWEVGFDGGDGIKEE